jgi:hypothetical protein
MQPNTLTGRGYKGKVYVKTLEKILVGSEKIIPDLSTTLLLYVIFCL